MNDETTRRENELQQQYCSLAKNLKFQLNHSMGLITSAGLARFVNLTFIPEVKLTPFERALEEE